MYCIVHSKIYTSLSFKDNKFLYSQTFRFLRAVAYRWLARWLFCQLGWENTRPLPACVYRTIRESFLTINETKGYVSGQERADQEI